MAKMAKKGSLPPLPSSKNRKFWGEDSELYLNKPKKIKMKTKHIFRQEGNSAVCTTCPFTHSVFLGPNMEVSRKGKIIKKRY